MYTTADIELVEKAVAWRESLDAGFPIELTEALKEGTTGRHFQSFHNLVTIDNLYSAVIVENQDEGDFNDFLDDLRKQAARQTLTRVFDLSKQYDPSTSASKAISENLNLLAEVQGFVVASMALEIFIASPRKNLEVRNAKLSIANLKLELDGFRNDNGVLVATGVTQKLAKAVIDARKKLFPKEATVTSEKIW